MTALPAADLRDTGRPRRHPTTSPTDATSGGRPDRTDVVNQRRSSFRDGAVPAARCLFLQHATTADIIASTCRRRSGARGAARRRRLRQ